MSESTEENMEVVKGKKEKASEKKVKAAGGGGACCVILGCNNKFRNSRKSDKKITFHSFPHDPYFKKRWLKLCTDRASLKPKNSRVCSEHFLPEDYELNFREQLLGIKSSSKLKQGVVPSQNLPTCFQKKETPTAMKKRLKKEAKHKELERKAIVAELLRESEKADKMNKSPKLSRSSKLLKSTDISSKSKRKKISDDNMELEELVDDPEESSEPCQTITVQTTCGVKIVPAASLSKANTPKTAETSRVTRSSSNTISLAKSSTNQNPASSSDVNFHRLYIEVKKKLEEVEKIAEDLRQENAQLQGQVQLVRDAYRREKYNFHHKLIDKINDIKSKSQISVSEGSKSNNSGPRAQESQAERRNRIMKHCFSLVKENNQQQNQNSNQQINMHL